MQLEAEARRAESVKALQFLIANDTRRLVSYRQAYVLEARHSRYRTEAISSLGVVDRNAPAVRWTDAVVSAQMDTLETSRVQLLVAEDVPQSLGRDWPSFSFPHAAMCPLFTPAGDPLAVLWINRDEPFTDAEHALLARLGETYGHAWRALNGGAVKRRNLPFRWIGLAVMLATVAAMFLPVRMTALAPAQVAATEPNIVAAPLSGVINEVLVAPNTRVEAGEPLFRFEPVDLRNEHAIAERRLDVARAAYRQAQSGAFQSNDSRARLAQLEAEVNLREIERDYARERLDRVTVTAQRPGLVVYSDPSDWEGRPVDVGERVMEIVSSSAVHLRIDLPVADAIVIEQGAEVEMFLDSDPLDPRRATVTSASYVAEKTAADVLAFPLKAGLAEAEAPPRIGLRGTAKIYGQQTTLFYYLFRRPISSARQFIGF
ncbi:MAG: HlyD family efflux transporter periplasmic adaptor subunit [Gammaproteobacteria bacterium]|nr:HlyD family efflux transporter periplasmic adaptor subunit [Gammaproteobacteria bacterium]